MRRSRRCSLAAALGLALAALAHAAAAAPAAPKAAAVVNGESITEADVERAARAAPPGTARRAVVEGLVEEALLVQEARRRRLDATDGYRRALRRWRQDAANGLLGAETLRRHLEEKKRRPGTFAEFHPRVREAWAALPPAEQAVVDAAVQERFGAITKASRVPLQAGLEAYTVLAEVPEDTAKGVVAARTSWGPITLADVQAEAAATAAHGGLEPDRVLAMWQQNVNEIAGREAVLRAAEEAGLFAAESVKREAAAAERSLLRSALVSQVTGERRTPAALGAWVEREAASLTREYGMTVLEVRLAAATRLEAEAEFQGIQAGKAGAAGKNRESLTLEKAWKGLDPDRRRLLLGQPWGSWTPLLRSKQTYVALRIDVTKKVEGARTLGDLAASAAGRDALRALVAELSAKASIKVH